MWAVTLRMLASLSRHLHELVTTIENYKLRDVSVTRRGLRSWWKITNKR